MKFINFDKNKTGQDVHYDALPILSETSKFFFFLL